MRSLPAILSALALGIFLDAGPASGQITGAPMNFLGRVVGIPSGDQLIVMENGRPVRFRLYGIECPAGPMGYQARLYLRQLAEARSVHVIPSGRDAQGRRLAKISFIGGKNPSEELLKAGLAKWDQRVAPHDWNLKYLERGAQRARRGLWADPPSRPAKLPKKHARTGRAL